MGLGLERRAKKVLSELGFEFQQVSFARTKASGRTGGFLLKPLRSSTSVVVFLHGTGNDALYPQISLFIKLLSQGLQIISFDLDGHGLRSTTKLDPSSLSTCLEELFEQKKLWCEVHKVHFVGQSLGGGLVLDFLARHQDKRFCSAALISTPLHLNSLSSLPYRELLSITRLSFLRQIAIYGPWHALPALGGFKRSQYPIRLEDRVANPSSLSYVKVVAAALDIMKLREKAAKVSTPMLLCYGDRDQIAPSSHGRILSHVMPNANLLTIEGETHFTTMFARQAEDGVAAWIKSHS